MRLISRRSARHFWQLHADAEEPLRRWCTTVEKARWRNVMDVRVDFPHADSAQVASGNTVTIFNIAGNKYRLIASIHYNRQILHLLRIMTHAEYDKEMWKGQL